MDVLRPESGPSIGRVALLVPRWTPREQAEPQGTPFRCFALGAGFLEAGLEVVFFDQEHDLDRVDRTEAFYRELDGCTAAFIWMNEAYPSNQWRNAHLLSAGIKAAQPDLPVVVGGEFITLCPPSFFDIDHPADYFLIGYGERSGVALVEHLDAGTAPNDVPGLVWRDEAGVLRHTPADRAAHYPSNFDALYRMLDMTVYAQHGGVFGNGLTTLTIGTGRGCVKRCGFCVWSNHPAKLRDADEIFGLMRTLHERTGVSQFHIGELDFFTSRSRALDLAARIADANADFLWYALGSPVDLREFSDEEWDRLHAGGLRKVEMGSESGSTRMLRVIGKAHDPDDIVAITEKLLARGIAPMNNFLFGAPGETHDDRVATLRVIDRLLAMSFEDNHLTYRHYQPGLMTELGASCVEHAPETPDRADTWVEERAHYDDERRRTMPWLPVDDERELKRLINHDLPLATSQLVFPSRMRRWLYAKLRDRAQQSLRRGAPTRPLDRWLYERFVGTPLDRTYVA